ncbi:hypothetical protein MN0502_29140 [Arthrobacter sp. MN05-02]|nr:hypothetical protein MN0502_29140 [Arthrobacter sp. MN05-02]
MVERKVEADAVERPAHALPDLLAWYGEVLGGEGHLVADAGEDHLRLGVLEHQPRPAPRRGRGDAVEQEFALLLALVLRTEHAGEAVQHGRLARPGRPEEQHALPRTDVEVEAACREGLPARVAPAPATGADLHGSRGRCVCWRHTSAERPAAKEDSAPVFARPRMASQESRPAMTTPGDGGEHGVEELELEGPERVIEDVLADRECEARAEAGQQRHRQVPLPVQEEQEDELGAGSLDRSGDEDAHAPLRADQGGHRCCEHLAEEGCTRLADDQSPEDAGDQPAPGVEARQRRETGRQQADAGVPRGPGEEQDADGDRDDRGHHDVDDAPLAGARRGALEGGR